MQKILSLIDRLLHFLLITTVLLLIIPVSLQIFSRFTELIPRYMWTEEMSRFFFVWLIMLGATLGVRERLHFDVDFFAKTFTSRNPCASATQPNSDVGFFSRHSLLGHWVHKVWLESNFWIGRDAHVVDLHCVAYCRFFVDCFYAGSHLQFQWYQRKF